MSYDDLTDSQVVTDAPHGEISEFISEDVKLDESVLQTSNIAGIGSTTSGVISSVIEERIIVPGKKGFLVDGLIQGTPITWKVDTGARKTFITEESYYNITPDSRSVLERVRSRFEAADGRELPLLGTAKMLLTFENVNIEFRVFVGSVTHDLLGEDFYSKFKCNWNHDISALSINCATVDEMCEVTPANKVISAESVIVPAGHEAVIKSTLSYASDSVVIPMPIKTFIHSHGLAVARTLMDARDGEVYIRLFNPGNEPVQVQENTLMAFLISVERVSEPFCEEKVEVHFVRKNGENQQLPDYLKDVFDQGCANLTPDQSKLFEDFLVRRRQVFADPNGKVQRTNIGEHSINLSEETPFKEAPRRVPIFKREILDAEIQKLVDQGLVEKSSSPWSSQLVLVQKKDKSWRVCVDYRRLNSKTIKDAYPIPRVDDDLDALAGSVWFSSLDLNMAYHQVPMSDRDKEKTAFATPRGGLYQYTVMPFGLCNAPATFQRIIEKALCGLQWNIAVLYLDDIIVYGKSFEEHLQNLERVFDRLQEVNLKVKAKKCSFFRHEVTFLGHVVSKDGIRTDPAKTDIIRCLAKPQTVTELRSFLGLVSYYRKFIKDFAHIAKCLHALTSKKSTWDWTPDSDHAFHQLKEKLISAPIL